MKWFSSLVASVATGLTALAANYGEPVALAQTQRAALYGAPLRIPLSEVFKLEGVNHRIVQFEFNVGTVNVELLEGAAPAGAPLTVANFLNYVQSGRYTNSFLHRSIPGFIVQGGGFGANGNTSNGIANVFAVAADPAVQNEYNVVRSNVRGTMAMAKLDLQPNSATNQWFWNLGDNSSNLNNQNGGFTVFAKTLTPSMAVIDAIAGLTIYNASGTANGVFSNLPALNDSLSVESLVRISSVGIVPIFAPTNGNGVLETLTDASPAVFATPTVADGIFTTSAKEAGTFAFNIGVRDAQESSALAQINVQIKRLIGDESAVSGTTVTSGSMGTYSTASAPWMHNASIGWFHATPASAPWVYHEVLGWMYLRSGNGGVYAFVRDSGLGWVYIPVGVFPRLYSYKLNRWLYIHLPTSTNTRLLAWDATVRGWRVIRL